MTDAAATSMELLDLLAEELRCCRRMVALAAAQRDAMLAGDVAALAPAVREMEGLAATLTRLEEERAAASSLTPAGGTGPVLGRGGEGEGQADQARLAELRAALRAALTELRALNDANAVLARRALTSTEQALRLLHAALPATYAANGTLRGPEAVRQIWTV